MDRIRLIIAVILIAAANMLNFYLLLDMTRGEMLIELWPGWLLGAALAVAAQAIAPPKGIVR